MKKFEELTDVEKALRALIFAVEQKDKHHPDHPFPMGEAYLQLNLKQARDIAIENNIPLV